jgi:DNA polymerase-1
VASAEGITVEEAMHLKYSRIHPEINIMGATATGRCSSSNPNVQQQPKRDEYSRPLIRSMFVPEEGETWYCLDFSAQEIVLQVHYATLIGSEHGKIMAEMWNTNPNYDVHEAVAERVGIDRKTAKTINLGLSYGMGVFKLARSLKISTKDASALIKQYHENAPYLKDLVTAAKSKILSAGFIKTLLGRKLYKDNTIYDDDGRMQDFSYKAINKLVQGAAADQTMASLVYAYRAGIPVLFPIHDEIALSSKSIEDVAKIHYIMEHVIDLKAPARSEVTAGPDFADQTKLDVDLSTINIDQFKKDFVPYNA